MTLHSDDWCKMYGGNVLSNIQNEASCLKCSHMCFSQLQVTELKENWQGDNRRNKVSALTSSGTGQHVMLMCNDYTPPN